MSKEKLTQAALEIAENHIKMAIDDVYKIAQIVVDDTTTPLDDAFLNGLKLLKSTLKKYADKIDGQEG